MSVNAGSHIFLPCTRNNIMFDLLPAEHSIGFEIVRPDYRELLRVVRAATRVISLG